MSPYFVDYGEGTTKANQITTAVSKLVYKWLNDGDIYDNRYQLKEGANDLSSYANWLSEFVDVGWVLDGIEDCKNDDDYTELLYRLCETVCDTELLEEANKEPAVGSVYDRGGSYYFEDFHLDDDDNDDDDEDW